MGGMGMNNGIGGPQGMGMPYPNGQGHLHGGMNAGQMGMNSGGGMPMGMGMNMNGPLMGVGQLGATPHPGLNVHSGEQGSLGKANQIWITGEFFGVQRARDMLLNVAVQKVSDLHYSANR